VWSDHSLEFYINTTRKKTDKGHNMNYHRSIPSLSSSIASSEPRTSSSSSTNNYYLYQSFNSQPLTYSTSLKSNKVVTSIEQKRYSEPLKRWDDSQLEMELAEDDLIMDKKKKVRRNSSFRLIDKFRHHRQQDQVKPNSITRSFKEVYDWLF
jgi:hypothetical protein